MFKNTENLGIKINIASNFIKNYFDKQIATIFSDITNTQLHIIMYLYDNQEKDVSQDKLAKMVEISHPAIRNIIKRMMKKDLVKIGKFETDKRKVKVMLTDYSIKKINDNEQVINDMIKNTMDKITHGIDEDQLNKFDQTLSKIIDNLK
ncbi:MarR family winged helix-turn-helix transcriptional regulator [Apilactobacillus micheneri]|nr:MarR family transcriptional regulator [Apilactobacillus micheneri]